MTMEKLLNILAAHGLSGDSVQIQPDGKIHCYCWTQNGKIGYDVLEIIDGKFHANGEACGLLAWLGY